MEAQMSTPVHCQFEIDIQRESRVCSTSGAIR